MTGNRAMHLELLKYWNNLRTQQSIFLVLDFIVHFSHYMFLPLFGGHLQVVRKHKKYLRTVILYSTDPLSRYVLGKNRGYIIYKIVLKQQTLKFKV
jgi:hypothetical protein